MATKRRANKQQPTKSAIPPKKRARPNKDFDNTQGYVPTQEMETKGPIIEDSIKVIDIENKRLYTREEQIMLPPIMDIAVRHLIKYDGEPMLNIARSYARLMESKWKEYELKVHNISLDTGIIDMTYTTAKVLVPRSPPTEQHIVVDLTVNTPTQ